MAETDRTDEGDMEVPPLPLRLRDALAAFLKIKPPDHDREPPVDEPDEEDEESQN